MYLLGPCYHSIRKQTTLLLCILSILCQTANSQGQGGGATQVPKDSVVQQPPSWMTTADMCEEHKV